MTRQCTNKRMVLLEFVLETLPSTTAICCVAGYAPGTNTLIDDLQLLFKCKIHQQRQFSEQQGSWCSSLQTTTGSDGQPRGGNDVETRQPSLEKKAAQIRTQIEAGM